jgi:MSHA biogenesis protein MshO
MVEMVIVIAIVSILSGALAAFMRSPLTALRDVERRATLVDVADHALGRLARDVAAALPNSLRVSADERFLELLHTVDGGRYRQNPGVNPGTLVAHGFDDALFFNAGDAEFNALGRLSNLTSADLAGHRVAVYPTDTVELYRNAEGVPSPITGVITQPTRILIVNDGDEDQIQLRTPALAPAPYKFQFLSPEQRMFIVDGAVTYHCNLGTTRLNRYWGYGVQQGQPADASALPLSTASQAPTADRLIACSFQYQPGTAQSAALLTVTLELEEHGESIRLLRQLHVDNTP